MEDNEICTQFMALVPRIWQKTKAACTVGCGTLIYTSLLYVCHLHKATRNIYYMNLRIT